MTPSGVPRTRVRRGLTAARLNLTVRHDLPASSRKSLALQDLRKVGRTLDAVDWQFPSRDDVAGFVAQGACPAHVSFATDHSASFRPSDNRGRMSEAVHSEQVVLVAPATRPAGTSTRFDPLPGRWPPPQRALRARWEVADSVNGLRSPSGFNLHDPPDPSMPTLLDSADREALAAALAPAPAVVSTPLGQVHRSEDGVPSRGLASCGARRRVDRNPSTRS